MRFKKLFFFGILFCCLTLNTFAQRGSGKVEIIQDSQISILQQKRIEYANTSIEDETEERRAGTKGTAMGFRVQIYVGPSRNDAYAVQARFQKTYSDVSTYVSYTQPNYRVKVGDFRSRQEAQALMQTLRKDYPSVFLFTEQVNVTY